MSNKKRVERAEFNRATLRSVLNDREYERCFWLLLLECGHVVERRVSWLRPGHRSHMKAEENALPPPERVRCPECE